MFRQPTWVSSSCPTVLQAQPVPSSRKPWWLTSLSWLPPPALRVPSPAGLPFLSSEELAPQHLSVPPFSCPGPLPPHSPPVQRLPLGETGVESVSCFPSTGWGTLSLERI